MFKNKNIVALILCVLMCFLVGCTGDPAEEVEQQIYNTAFLVEETTNSTTQSMQTEQSSDEETLIEPISSLIDSSAEDSKHIDNVTNQTKIISNNVKPNKSKSATKKKVVIVSDDKQSTLKNNVTVVDTTKIYVEKTVASTPKNETKTIKTTVLTTELTTVLTATQTTTLAPLSDDDICYVTANGEKYHREGCRYLNRSCIEIVVSEAKEQGYTPCKVCKP